MFLYNFLEVISWTDGIIIKDKQGNILDIIEVLETSKAYDKVKQYESFFIHEIEITHDKDNCYYVVTL